MWGLCSIQGTHSHTAEALHSLGSSRSCKLLQMQLDNRLLQTPLAELHRLPHH